MIRTHRVSWFVPINWNLFAAKQILRHYTETINAVLSYNTVMRLEYHENRVSQGTFSPEPQTLDEYPNDHEIKIYISQATNFQSGRGSMTVDSRGNGIISGLKWTKLHDYHGETFNLGDFWIQIQTVLHEIGHIRGLGLGEVYSILNIQDKSNIAPIISPSVWFGESDIYWGQRMDLLKDPMASYLYNHPLFPESGSLNWLMENQVFCSEFAEIINGHYRLPNPLPPLPDMDNIKIKYLNYQQSPQPGVNVKIWSASSDLNAPWTLLKEGVSDSNGEFNFSWHKEKYNRPVICIKGFFGSMEPAVSYFSIYDCQKLGIRGVNNIELTYNFLYQKTSTIKTSPRNSVVRLFLSKQGKLTAAPTIPGERYAIFSSSDLGQTWKPLFDFVALGDSSTYSVPMISKSEIFKVEKANAASNAASAVRTLSPNYFNYNNWMPRCECCDKFNFLSKSTLKTKL